MRKPTVEIFNVTPQIALEWLERIVPNNRKVRGKRIQLYAADMKAGRWHLSGDAIVFNEDGMLANATHRLHAVVSSGCTCPFIVLRHMPNEAMIVQDSGMKRSTDDNFMMCGRDWPKNCGATVRKLMYGLKQNRAFAITDQEVDEFMDNNGDVILFAHECLPQGRMSKSIIRAVIARARMKNHTKESLRRFAEVLQTGMMTPGEDAAVRLRNWIMEMHSGTTRGAWRDLYGKTEAALAAFLEGEKLVRLNTTAIELFPIKSIDITVSNVEAGELAETTAA